MSSFKYYVFISYSRKDSRAAAYLHRQLECFRIPMRLVPQGLLENGQKYLRPVFRDRRDLNNSERSFTNDIKTAIEAARYLLVLCSPNSASSHWVNEEVHHFIEYHGGDCSNVVPVILNGSPGSGKVDECLPPALRIPEVIGRNLPSMLPDYGEPEKYGWEAGLVQAMSFMLKVDREKIKASVDLEHIRLRLLRIRAIVACCVAVVFAFLTAWAVHAENIAKRSRRLAEISEAKAREHAEIAEKSLEFLGDMFQYSDPILGGNKDMKVLDAIQAKLPEIPRMVPWQLRTSVSNQIASILSNLGEYETSLQLLLDSIKLYENNDPKSIDSMICYNNLGSVYTRLGQYEEALKNYQKAMEINLDSFGEYHPSIAISYNNFANVYDKQGKNDIALKFYQKALEINLRNFGENHSTTAISYNNLGGFYYNHKNFEKALQLYKKALEIRIRLFGEEHSVTAASYNNIGGVYLSQRKYEDALRCHQKALAIRLKVLGENHPELVSSYNFLGLIAYNKGNNAAAVRFYQKALEINMRVFGESHPNTANSYNNLGNVFNSQNNYNMALSYHKMALEIRVKVFGKVHPGTADSYNNVAKSLWFSGDKNKALEFEEMAVSIAEKTLGKEHPTTRQYMANLNKIKQAEMTKAE